VTSAVPQSPGLPSSDGPSSLIDGDPDTLAYPGSNHLDYTISLAGPTHVSAAAISWGVYGTQTGYVQSWTLYGRNGSSNAWQVLTQGGVPSVAVTGVQLNQIVTDLRIVADGANWIGIYELSIAGAAPLSGLVATSNMLEVPIVSATPALNLVDGNDSTMSYISNINTDYSIALPSLSYIDGVRIVWGDFGTTATYIDHWQLYGQKPGNAEWQVLARGENPGTSETVVNVLDTFSSLRIAAESDLNWIGIYEVHVFGAAAPAPSIRQ
jgi:hypothetical protein